jgi:hypothetical protein
MENKKGIVNTFSYVKSIKIKTIPKFRIPLNSTFEVGWCDTHPNEYVQAWGAPVA